MNDVPLLPVKNYFNVLTVEEIKDDSPAISDTSDEKSEPSIRITRRPKWERKLPETLKIDAAEPGSNSLYLRVEIESTETQRKQGIRALVDCGATGLFIDREYVKSNRLPTKKLSRVIPVFNVDGTPNEAGCISEVVELIIRYEKHSERALFAVTGLGRQNLILGITWLREHNPEIDWRTGKVEMTRCLPRCCIGCRDEVRTERRNLKKEEASINACRAGPFPEMADEASEPEDEPPAADLPFDLEEGDRVWATGLLPEVQYVQATSTISQRLAESFSKHTESKPTLPTGGIGSSGSIPDYVKMFGQVFSEEGFAKLPNRKPWDHAIELTPGAQPKGCKVYPLSVKEQAELDVFITENLETGRIQQSKSPMASPVFFIKKKDGSLRLVQDYRMLNEMTVKNKYPLPLIPELINQLRGAKYFTKLDVRWGFNNVRIKEGDEWKAAFRTNRGLFEPLVMFFGLTNSPATFQTMMNEIFIDMISEGVVVVYLDDILIFTKTLDEHRQVTRRVLGRLAEHELFLRPEKCEFEKTRIEYLGLIISENHVEMDPVKVAGVAEWPQPKNKREVQSFLGFANFYRRFIKDFSHHARPLFDLTRNDQKWKWDTSEATAFRKLKESITSAPVLTTPADNRPFRIEADSSDFATGAVLSQLSAEDEKWHPVAYLSKSLSETERNYEIHDKEMLAIIRALEEWRHFLEGAPDKFEIWTDHKNLEYFMSAKKLNRRQARWSLTLARFDFVMHHRPGKTMGKSDALSRRADHGSGSEDNRDITLLTPNFFAVRALEGTRVEGEEQELLKLIRRETRDGELEDAVTKAAKLLKSSSAKSVRSSEWSEDDGMLHFRGKIYVPPSSDIRRKIVALNHDSRIAGHPGRWKTLELVSRNYWWPQMSRYIGQYTATCDLCLRTKAHKRLPTGYLEPLPTPNTRWHTISVDFIVELPESDGYDAIMVVVDSLTKRSHFLPVNTTITAEGSARQFRDNVWKLHGLPTCTISDRGPQFTAAFTAELYRLLGIKAAKTTAYHPQADGQTERVNQELEQYLRLFVGERQDDWVDLLPMAEFQYNNHIHSSTQQTPFFLDSGQHPRMGFEPQQPSRLESVNEFTDRMKLALEEAKSALAKAKDDMARYYNQRRLPTPVYKPGDLVYLDASDIKTTRPSRKLSHRRLGPFPVERRVSRNAYRLRLPFPMRRLHPVFNIVKLTTAPPDPIPGRHPQPPPPPEVIDGEDEYLVEKILDSKMFRGRLKFKIKWEGYGPEHDSWEYATEVYAPERVADFYQRNPAAPRQIRAATFSKIPFRPISPIYFEAKQP